MFLHGSFCKGNPEPTGVIPASVSFPTPLPVVNWTSLLSSLGLERRGNIGWIVLQMKGTKPAVKMVTRVLLASQ